MFTFVFIKGIFIRRRGWNVKGTAFIHVLIGRNVSFILSPIGKDVEHNRPEKCFFVASAFKSK